MTLTDMLPSLRRCLPDPFAPPWWPAGTVATTTDMVIRGVSVRRIAEVCGTPCVHNDDPPPGRRDRPSVASVVVVSVLDVATSRTGARAVVLDGCLDSVEAKWTEARLIGRISTAHRVDISVLSRGAESCAMARLPDDLMIGDIVTVPCAGWTLLRDVRVVVS